MPIMSWMRWPGTKRRLIGERLAHVASVVDDPFAKRANLAAEELGPKAIRILWGFRNRTPPKPIGFEDRFDGFGEWQTDGDPVDAFELIAALALHNPDAARKHGEFLRCLMRGEGVSDRSQMLDEKVRRTTATTVVAISGISYPHIVDFHAVRAAILLRRLFPNDAQATASLHTWQVSHPDESVREQINQHFAKDR
jgi:hypothetical protein